MKTLTFPANELQDYIGGDLEDGKHLGFTIGKGKKMYWYFIWHSASGNATVYTADIPMDKRYIKNEQLITVHFKD